MQKYIYVLGAIAMATISTQAHAGAAAICIEKTKNSAGNWYDSEYFVRYGKSPNVDGFVAQRAAKQDHRKSYKTGTPYCRHTGTNFKDGGHMIVLKSNRTKDSAGAHWNKWALGFGKSRGDALESAMKEMRRRDSRWRTTHGFKIVEDHPI